MSSRAFEPAILAIKRFRTYGLDLIVSEVCDYVFIIMYSLCICIMYLVHATWGLLKPKWINIYWRNEYIAQFFSQRMWLLGLQFWDNDYREH
jgi:hypothetical protein